MNTIGRLQLIEDNLRKGIAAVESKGMECTEGDQAHLYLALSGIEHLFHWVNKLQQTLDELGGFVK